MVTQEIIFDRKLLRQNRARALKNFAQHNFLFIEVANRIAENVQFLNRNFDSMLELGARDGYLSNLLNAKNKIASDINLIADDEFLPFKAESFDLILSNLNMHHINQMPQFLLQAYQILKPGGVFIASFFGEENLSQLAHVLYESENQLYNGMSPRMPPTIDVKTAANLLAKAGFQNPISDFSKIEVEYSKPLNLLKDLKAMGQGNVLVKRSRRFVTKSFLNKIDQNYRKIYSSENGNVEATFEIVTVTGWKETASQK